MRWRNTPERYGTAAKLLHWGMAALVIGMLWVGLYMVGLPLSPDKFQLYGLHKATGAVVLAVVSLRLAWRLFDPVPPFPDSMRAVDKLGAHAAHYMLYALLFLMPLSGWAMSSAAGFPVSVYGLFTLPNIVPADKALLDLSCATHEWMAYALIGLIVLHVAAALWHHFVRKDNILRRML
jgi:cytochrome b561